MNGKIEVDSVRGEGSTFRFFVKSSVPATNQVLEKTVARTSSVAAAKKRPLHVLIVEDNHINQRVLARQLKKASLTCEGMWSVSLDRSPFDLVIVTVLMG